MDNNLRRFLKFFWILSIFMFLFSLLYTYAGFPDQVNTFSGKSGDLILSKGGLFYIALITFVLVNTVFLVLNRMLNNYLGASSGKLSLKKVSISGWINGFLFIINFFIISILYFLFNINQQGTENFSTIGMMVMATAALLLGWLVYLAFILIRAPKPVID